MSTPHPAGNPHSALQESGGETIRLRQSPKLEGPLLVRILSLPWSETSPASTPASCALKNTSQYLPRPGFGQGCRKFQRRWSRDRSHALCERVRSAPPPVGWCCHPRSPAQRIPAPWLAGEKFLWFGGRAPGTSQVRPIPCLSPGFCAAREPSSVMRIRLRCLP